MPKGLQLIAVIIELQKAVHVLSPPLYEPAFTKRLMPVPYLGTATEDMTPKLTEQLLWCMLFCGAARAPHARFYPPLCAQGISRRFAEVQRLNNDSNSN